MSFPVELAKKFSHPKAELPKTFAYIHQQMCQKYLQLEFLPHHVFLTIYKCPK